MKISNKVGESADDLKRMETTMLRLDLAVARARHSAQLEAVEPTFIRENNEHGTESSDLLIDVRNLRHPLLVWRAIEDRQKMKKGAVSNPNVVMNQTGNISGWSSGDESSSESPTSAMQQVRNEVVPASYTLHKGVKCAVVTGPNTGGKTVALKNLGTAVLMAKAGLFLLTDPDMDDTKPKLPFFDHVLCDIGDDQSIIQNLSTFSGHIQRVKRILSMATDQSLVLLDEVGSGTDPTEGAALGISLLQHLADTVKLTFATTHHGELKTLKYSDEQGRFENASAEFDDQAMRPTYRLIWGIPGRSNALAIAERLGFPMNLLNAARSSLIGSNNIDVNSVISALEEQRQRQEEDLVATRKKLKEAEKMREEAEQRLLKLREAEAKFKAEKNAIIEREVAKAKQSVNEVIKKMQQDGNNARAATSARNQLDEITKVSSSSTEAFNDDLDTEEKYIPQKGDKVIIPRLGDGVVEVVENINAKGELIVLFGNLRTKVKASEVVMSATANAVARRKKRDRLDMDPRMRMMERTSKQQVLDQGSYKGIAMQTSQNTVDVRGETVDDGISKIEVALGRALSTGCMFIIHGHGTGKLRAGIHEYLKSMPSTIIKGFKYADQSEGGTGCTVVEFR